MLLYREYSYACLEDLALSIYENLEIHYTAKIEDTDFTDAENGKIRLRDFYFNTEGIIGGNSWCFEYDYSKKDIVIPPLEPPEDYDIQQLTETLEGMLEEGRQSLEEIQQVTNIIMDDMSQYGLIRAVIFMMDGNDYACISGLPVYVPFNGKTYIDVVTLLKLLGKIPII